MAHINGKYGNTDTDRHLRSRRLAGLLTRPDLVVVVGTVGLGVPITSQRTSNRFRNDFWSLSDLWRMGPWRTIRHDVWNRLTFGNGYRNFL